MLFETLVITGVMLVVPESWLLRPLLRMFGMAAEGPVAGVWASLASIHICACTLLALTFARIHCLCSYMHMVEFCIECVSVRSRHVSVSAHTHFPLMGTPVACAQRRFYGAYIPKGSWFSHLQSAGMTRWASSIWKTVSGAIAAGVGLVGSLFSGVGSDHSNIVEH